MPHILGAGLVALDLIVEHRPNGQTLSASGGGTCGNVLAILAHMGWSASWLGTVGSSGAGQIVRTEMERTGVHLHSVAECDSSPAPVFAHHVRFSDSGELLQHWFSNECPHCARILPRYARPSDSWLRSQAHEVERADIFFVDRLSAAVVELAATARSNGALVVYEPSATSDIPWLEDMLGIADVIKYSHERIAALGDARDRPKGNRALWIETRGREGLCWSRSDESDRARVLPSVRNPRAIDACGAGDWFTSALLFGLAQTKNKPADLGDGQLTQILGAASRLAAWSCGFLGARGGLYEAPARTIFEQLCATPSLLEGGRSSLPRPAPSAHGCGWCPAVYY